MLHVSHNLLKLHNVLYFLWVKRAQYFSSFFLLFIKIMKCSEILLSVTNEIQLVFDMHHELKK